MKLLKVFTATAVVALTGFALTLAFAEDATNPQPGHHGQRGAGTMFEHILPPKIVEALALTADQKTMLDGLETAFKKDVAKWRAENPVDDAAVKQARETGDREALRKLDEKRQVVTDLRKGYVDKFRAALTDEQKTKLGKVLEEARNRKPGAKPGKAATPPPPAE